MSRKRNGNNRNHRTETIEEPGTEAPSGPQSNHAAERKSRFLAAIQLGVSVAEAARWVGIPRTTLYRWRRNDPEFAWDWDNPKEQNPMVRSLEFEAFKRALNGNDRLLVFLLKSYDPNMFSERRRNELLAEETRQERGAALIAAILQRRREEEPAAAVDTPSGPRESLAYPSPPVDPLEDADDLQEAGSFLESQPLLEEPQALPSPETGNMAQPRVTRRPSLHI